MSAGCVTLPISTVYSTPTVSRWHKVFTLSPYTVPAATSTIVDYVTICNVPPYLEWNKPECPFGYRTELWTTTATYPPYATLRRVFLSLSAEVITLPPVPISTLYGASCTTNSSSSSSTSISSTSSTSIIHYSSSSSTSALTSILTSSTNSRTSSSSTSISSTHSSSSTSSLTLSSSVPPPPPSTRTSSRSTPRTTPPRTPTRTPFTVISTRTRPSAPPHSSLPRETQPPSRSHTRTRLTLSHASSARPVTRTATLPVHRSTVTPRPTPTLRVSSRPPLQLTFVPTQATRTRASEISRVTRTRHSSEVTRATRTRPLTGSITHSEASESAYFGTVLAATGSDVEETTDVRQVFQPYSQTDRTARPQWTRSRDRPQTRTAVRTRPATAHHTPDRTHDRTQQYETAERAPPNGRPTDRPDETADRATSKDRPTDSRETDDNTSQRILPATNRSVSPQPSRTLPQPTTVQPSIPAVTSAAQTPATTTGGITTNTQASDDERRKPNIGLIVGGIIGILAFIALFTAAAVKYVKPLDRGGGGGRGREEEVAVTQSLMSDFFQQGLFGGAAGGIGGHGAGIGKGGPGNKPTGPGGSGAQGGEGSYDPEMSQVYNNASASGADELGPNSQHPNGPGPSTFGDSGAYSTGAPTGHTVGGYGVGAGGAEGVAHGHGAGAGGYENVAPNAGGGGAGLYGNVAPGGSSGGGAGGLNAIAPPDGAGGFGHAGVGGGGAANAPTAPPGAGSGGELFGTDVSTGINPTQSAFLPGGGDIPASGGGGHHGPGFIPVIVPIGARKRPAASQTSLKNTLPTPYLMTGTATYDGGYPAGAVSSTSVMGGNYSSNERLSTDGSSRRYSLSDGLYGGPAYGRYEDPFEGEERYGLLPSYEATSGARRRNEKDYR